MKSVFKVLIPVLVIIAVVVGALFLIKKQESRPPGGEPEEIRVGSVVPDVKVKRLSGEEVALSSIDAKLVLLNFWATWCESCVVEMPSIVALRNAFKSNGFEVVGINVDENPQEVVPNALKEMNIEFPVFIDPENKLADLFDVHAIPLSVILNRDRKVLYMVDGEQDWNSAEVREQVQEWLNQ